MAYIFHTPHYFSLIDATSKNGVFCQFFSSNHNPKPIQIQSQPTTSYSGHMDAEGNLYVAAMPDASHLNYYTFENNRFIKHTLVASNTSNYQLSSPILYTDQNTPYLIYLSHQIHSTAYSFVQENLFQPQLTTLFTCYIEPQLVKSFITPSDTFIFFITYDENYLLNVLRISKRQVTSSICLQSSQPILDYSVCIEEGLLHIVYVAELHGKYQLNYFNTATYQLTPLATSQYPCNPVVFCYYNMIWVNAFINHKLQMLISIDHGLHFSIPVPCSLQNNIHRCHFLTQSISPFTGQELYASITSTLKLCTLAMIDIPHFHTESVISPELDLLLEGLMLSIENLSKSTASTKDMPLPISEPHKDSTFKTSPPTTTSHSSMDEAKNAFMNELTGGDLPPKI